MFTLAKRLKTQMFIHMGPALLFYSLDFSLQPAAGWTAKLCETAKLSIWRYQNHWAAPQDYVLSYKLK